MPPQYYRHCRVSAGHTNLTFVIFQYTRLSLELKIHRVESSPAGLALVILILPIYFCT